MGDLDIKNCTSVRMTLTFRQGFNDETRFNFTYKTIKIAVKLQVSP